MTNKTHKNKEIIGNKIKALREDNHLSQEELAEAIRASRQSVSKWENHETYPSLKNIRLIGEVFKVTTDYLMMDEAETSDEVAVSDAAPPVVVKPKKKKIYLACLITFSVLFIVFLILSLWFGKIAFSPNHGDNVNKIYVINHLMCISAIVACCVDFFLIIIFILLIKNVTFVNKRRK